MDRATSHFLDHVGDLPDTDYISVRYEDLCRDPEKNVARILDFLEVSSAVERPYDAFIDPRSVQLLPEIARKYDDIQERLASYSVYWGYDG
jgi:hypothetical protein